MRNAIKEQKRHKIESKVDAVGTRTDLSRLLWKVSEKDTFKVDM